MHGKALVNSPMTRINMRNDRPKLTAKSSTLQLNIVSAPLGSALPQAICDSLDQWQPGNTQSCPHELWLSLHLDDEEWKIFDKFTLRLSWPAFVSIRLAFILEHHSGIRRGHTASNSDYHGHLRPNFTWNFFHAR